MPGKTNRPVGVDLGRLADCLLQNFFVRPTPRTAIRKLTVDDDTRHALNAVLLCSRRDMSLMHIVNFDVVRRARNALDHLHRLVTRRATGAEDLDLFPLCLSHCSFSLVGSTQPFHVTLSKLVLSHCPRF